MTARTYGSCAPAPTPVVPDGPRWRVQWVLVAAVALGCAALVALATSAGDPARNSAERTELTGVIGNDAGMSSRWEGSNAKFGMPSYSNDAMNAKEEETGFGVAGQLGTGTPTSCTPQCTNFTKAHPRPFASAYIAYSPTSYSH